MKRNTIILVLLLLAILALAFSAFVRLEPTPTQISQNSNSETRDVSVFAKNLNIPWDLVFLPDGNVLVTERVGNVVLLDKNGGKMKTIPENNVQRRGEGGLLGITLHPDFENNRFIYLYMTVTGANGQTVNKVVRYVYRNDELTEERVIIDNIPGAANHDGGRILFGPDKLLYITTGDAGVSRFAQDTSSLAGKILRLNDDGSIPNTNPFNTAVYSYGHRNPQGLAWDSAGRLWETEHGRSGVLSGYDELNLIQPGNNYGWPVIEGDKKQERMTSPAVHSGPDTTWAPAGLVFVNNKLFFGGLRGEALYEAELEVEKVKEVREHFNREFGRIRTAVVGPDGWLYITTSNRDGRGNVRPEDDKIIKINPASLSDIK